MYTERENAVRVTICTNTHMNKKPDKHMTSSHHHHHHSCSLCKTRRYLIQFFFFSYTNCNMLSSLFSKHYIYVFIFILKALRDMRLLRGLT